MAFSSRFVRTAVACAAVLSIFVASGCGNKQPPPNANPAPNDKLTSQMLDDAAGRAGGNPNGGNKVDPPPGFDPLEPAHKGSLPADAPIVALTADELMQEFKKDSNATLKRYEKSIIEVSGTVDYISSSGDSAHGQVFLKVKGGVTILDEVTCFLVEPEPWGKIGPDQTVKIKGLLSHTLNDRPALIKGVLGELGPNPTMIVTSEALSKEFVADAKAADKKYFYKYVIVTGEFVSERYNRHTYIRLKSDDKFPVEMLFNTPEGVEAPIRKGQTVKLYARVAGTSDNKVTLDECLLFSKP